MSSSGVVALPGCSATSSVWRHRGRVYLTVVAKAVFVADANGALHRAEPEPIVTEDVPLHGHPLSSVRVPRESGPPLSRAEVIVNGHACAPPAGPVSRMLCRLRMCAGEQVLIDKTLSVESSVPFLKMPVAYERAYGGIGAAENPVGTGAREGDRPPNILDPADARKPIGFAAIPASWRSRRTLLGALRKDALQAPIVDLPDDFAWEYFQAAPLDQRLDFFRGGETIELHGLSPRLPCLTLRLPRVRGLARIFGPGGDEQTIALKADALRVEADEERCVLLCRGNVVLPDVRAAQALRILVGVEADGEPIRWPELRPAASLGKTVMLADSEPPESSMALSLDEGDIEFVDEATSQLEPIREAEPAVATKPAARAPLDTTLASEPKSRWSGEPAPTTLPFRAGAPAVLSIPLQRSPRQRRSTDTVEIVPDEPAARRVMPFLATAAAPAVLHAAESPEPASPPPPASPVVDPSPPVAAPPTAPTGPVRVYAGDHAEAPPPAAPPPARKPPSAARVPSPPGPSADLKRGLYGRFSK